MKPPPAHYRRLSQLTVMLIFQRRLRSSVCGFWRISMEQAEHITFPSVFVRLASSIDLRSVVRWIES